MYLKKMFCFYFRIPLTKLNSSSSRIGEDLHFRRSRSLHFGNTLFGDDFGFGNLFDPLRHFEPNNVPDFGIPGFGIPGFHMPGFDMPSFGMPPMEAPVQFPPIGGSGWPFSLPPIKFHIPVSNGIDGNGAGSDGQHNQNQIPNQKQPISKTGNRVHLKNFNDVNSVSFC